MIVCPQCKREVPPADFNIATDIAFCRHCNRQYTYSDLASTVSARGFDNSTWPKHLKYTTNAEGEQITYKQRSPVLLFLIPFTAFWSGFSMYGLYIEPILQHKLTWAGALFGIPFLIGTVILVSVIVMLLFGVFKVHIGNGEAWLGWSVLGFTKKKSFNPRLIESVLLKNSKLSRNNVTQREIVLKFKDGQTINFGAMMNDEAKQKVAEFLAQKRF